MKKRISLTKVALLIAALLCLVVGFVLLGSSNVKGTNVANAEAVTEHGYGDNLVIQPSPTKGQDGTGFKAYSGA